MSRTMTKASAFAGLILAATAIAGCEPQVSKWTPAEVQYRPTVEQVRSNATIYVERTSGELAPGEAERLGEFLQGLGDPYAVRIRLTGPQAADRIRPLAGHLVLAGVLPENISIVAGQAATGGASARQGSSTLDAVQIVADKYVAVLPSCPNWSHADSDDGNRGTSFLGCSNNANLGAMVADPRDLMVGRGSFTTDGETAATAAANYRAGKVKPLPERNTGMSTTSAGGN